MQELLDETDGPVDVQIGSFRDVWSSHLKMYMLHGAKVAINSPTLFLGKAPSKSSPTSFYSNCPGLNKKVKYDMDALFQNDTIGWG